MDEPKVTMWKGRPLTELTREELIDALETMGRLYHEHIEDSMRSMRVMRELREASKGPIWLDGYYPPGGFHWERGL